MDWTKGFSAKYYASIVDRYSWRDIERIEITGGEISRGDGDLRESADLDCIDFPAGEHYIRVYLDARQNGATEHIPLFTGLTSCPASDIDGVYITHSIECYSVLKPAQDILLERGWYAGAGRPGALIIKELLEATPAPVVIEGDSPALQSYIIAEDGETNLSMVNKILDAINWRIRITGDGIIHLQEKSRSVSAVFDTLENDSIEPQLTKERDLFDCPNILRVINGDDSVTVIDNDSELSVESRGRQVWSEITSVDLNENETLYEYAERKLKELQQVAETVSYDRRYDPGVLVGDLVELNLPAQGITGIYTIASQKVELAYGAKTTEEVTK